MATVRRGNFRETDNLVVLGEPGIVRLYERGAHRFKCSAEPFGSAIFQLRVADETARLTDKRRPVGIEGHLEFDAGDAVVIVFGAAADATAGDEKHGLDRLGDGRSFKTQVLRNERSAAGGGLR